MAGVKEIMQSGENTLLRWERTADIPADGWDGLASPDDLFLSLRWLRVVEETARTPMRYLYVQRGGEPVAALTTALATADVPWVSGRVDHLLDHCAAEGFDGAADLQQRLGGGASSLLPTVHCGGRHVGRTRVLHTAGPDKAPRADVELLVMEAEKLAADTDSASVSFPYVDERDSTLVEVLRERGYASFTSGNYHWLSVPPAGFPAYAAALPRKRRVSALSERSKVRAAGFEITHEPVTPDIIDTLADLEVQLLAKYELEWPHERSAAAIGTAAARFGDDASVLLARADGALRGFALMLRRGDQWYARQCGFDYGYLGKLPLYYELLYYFAVERAAELSVATIQYGMGSDTAKRSRGCTSTRLSCHVLLLGRRG
ncbi:GNAT family N-acetyltransferase [Streptomyces sp. B-S-A8]|uniref:GNAT family N-acetyltransferase n=1 Tax=Streptomyces solicavernae TaxID=3043614 RepID=A0ABT6RY36_9ACTN|nr:GNAT family N-acetyltransferase [Streptomyces sp. B-S-A8]MDI3389343.1 GNAT family N-acetyltransferase [Streptomyces sp. B-S-A8]